MTPLIVKPGEGKAVSPIGGDPSFWNAGTSPGRFLLIISPAEMAPFLDEINRVMAESPTDAARPAAVAALYGIEFV